MAHRCTDARGLSSLMPCNSWALLAVGFHSDLKKPPTTYNRASEFTPVVCRSNPLGHNTHLYPRESLFRQGEVAALSMYFAPNIGGRKQPNGTATQLLARGLCLQQSGCVDVAGTILALTYVQRLTSKL